MPFKTRANKILKWYIFLHVLVFRENKSQYFLQMDLYEMSSFIFSEKKKKKKKKIQKKYRMSEHR